jgi:hypothetical protein
MERPYSLIVDAYAHISPPGYTDVLRGFRSYRQTINAIAAMDITDAEKQQIFPENALQLLRLPT